MGRLVLFLCASLLALPAGAQQTRPPGWSPGSEDARTSELVDGINRLVDDAERRRAADPIFLRDLRALAGRFDRPWRREVLYDDFGDGEFAADPAWQVAEGYFRVEWRYGLRSVVTAPTPAPAAGGQQQQVKPEDFAGAILRGLLGPQQQQQQGSGQAGTGTADRAEIYVPATISNAFSIRLELHSGAGGGQVGGGQAGAAQPGGGELEFGTYQGANRAVGYRLLYRPGRLPALQLIRRTKWGAGVVMGYGRALALEDGQPHIIEWTRDRGGEMAVSVDGRKLFTVVDRGFRDPFAGFVLLNRGGDFGLRRILIAGTG